MNWALAIVCLLVGLGLGFLIGKRSEGSKSNIKRLQQEQEQARFELEQAKQGISDYFEQSRSQMAALRQELEKTEQLWLESAQELLNEPVAEVLPETEQDNSNVTSLPPNDYVQGSHGIIGENNKVANS